MRRGLAGLVSCLFGMIASVLVACEPSDPTPVGRGRGIFQRTCSGCHGRDGRGTMRPGLTRPPRDLTNPAFQAQMTDEQLRQSIRVGKGQMPAFGGLMGDEEIANVIAYVRSLVPPGAAPPGSAPGAVPAAAPGAPPAPGPSAVPSSAAPASGAPVTGAASAVSPGAAVAGTAGASAAAELTARGANAP